MPKDFFISYNGRDEQWAKWIAGVLEEDGYTTTIQAWDFRPGNDFVEMMDCATKECESAITVLSKNYLSSNFTAPEWHTYFRQDPRGKKRRLLPVRIEDISIEGLLGSIVYIDLVGHDADAAKKKLLEGVSKEPVERRSPFPGFVKPPNTTPFPGSLPLHWNIPHRQNPNFTGREDILKQLRESLISSRSAAVTQAIHGLGGVGKTQIAIQYVYTFKGCALTIMYHNTFS